MSIDSSTIIDTARQARLSEITAAAITRTELGQRAHYRRLADGQHHVAIFDRTAGVLCEGTGATVAEAISAVQQQGAST